MRDRRSIRSRAAIAILASAGVLAAVGQGRALHMVSAPFTQVSQQTSGTVGRSSSTLERYWAFEASGDSLGNGNHLRNLFLYDHTLRVLGGTLGVTQITCGDFDPSNPSLVKLDNRMAFEADGGLCADPRHNCDSLATPTVGRQIFVWSGETGQIEQVTNCPGNCTRPSLSANGRMIVFESDVTLIGPLGVPLPKPDLYQVDLKRMDQSSCRQVPCGGSAPTAALRRLTFSGGSRAVQSSNGAIVVFQSDGDPVNNGASPGIDHVYLLTMPRDPFVPITSGLLRQVSTASYPARNPTTKPNGKLIAFEQDMPYGGTGPVVTQIVLAKFNPKKGALPTQITNGAQNSFHPSLSSNGRNLTFVSAGDLLGFGYPGNHIYHYTVGKGTLRQLTAGFNGADFPQATKGPFVGFGSADDLLGNGNTTQQYWIANTYRQGPGGIPVPMPTPTPRPSTTPTPTVTPFAGIPADIVLELVADEAADNGDNTVTTVLAVTVSDAVGNTVPDGTLVELTVGFPTGGTVVSDGHVNADPDCDVSRFEQKTGHTIINRTSVAHVCLTYPAGLVGSSRTIRATAGPMGCVGGATPFAACASVAECGSAFSCSNDPDTRCDPFAYGNDECAPGGVCEEHPATACEHSAVVEESVTLPPAHDDCEVNGQPCSDFNPCTVGDVCTGGLPDRACVGGSNPGVPCTSSVQCPDLNACVGGTNAGGLCGVASECPGGSCVVESASGGCRLTTPPTCQPATTTSCPDDGNACTVDVCNYFTGACGIPPECPDDHDPCSDDVCNPVDGTCGVTNTAACEDGNPCTTPDVCSAGSCEPGPVITCADDGNGCTIDECNPMNGECGIRFDPCTCSGP